MTIGIPQPTGLSCFTWPKQLVAWFSFLFLQHYIFKLYQVFLTLSLLKKVQALLANKFHPFTQNQIWQRKQTTLILSKLTDCQMQQRFWDIPQNWSHPVFLFVWFVAYECLHGTSYNRDSSRSEICSCHPLRSLPQSLGLCSLDILGRDLWS